MRAANYYLQHLDHKVQVIVVSDVAARQQPAFSGTPSNHSRPVPEGQRVPDTSTLHAAHVNSDDELDQLLQSGGPEDFDLGAPAPAHSCTHVQTSQGSQVGLTVVCC